MEPKVTVLLFYADGPQVDPKHRGRLYTDTLQGTWRSEYNLNDCNMVLLNAPSAWQPTLI